MAKIVNWIEEFYPQYMGIKRYPANQCACVKGAADEWGILGNFGRASVVVNGVEFCNTEKLFQCMKFTYAPVVQEIYAQRNMSINFLNNRSIRKLHALEQLLGVAELYAVEIGRAHV